MCLLNKDELVRESLGGPTKYALIVAETKGKIKYLPVIYSRCIKHAYVLFFLDIRNMWVRILSWCTTFTVSLMCLCLLLYQKINNLKTQEDVLFKPGLLLNEYFKVEDCSSFSSFCSALPRV